MTVNPDKPFQVIYSLSLNSQVGPVVEPFAVQLNDNGKFTLSYQRIHQSNIQNFDQQLTKLDDELVGLMDQYAHETLSRKFSKQKRRPADFLNNELTEDLYKRYIRPYIEEKMNKVLAKIIGHASLYLNAKRGNPAWKKLDLVQQPATAVFHFKKQEAGTLYYPTIKSGDAFVNPADHHAHIIVNEPCWLLVNKKLYHFSHFMEGAKLQQFLNKWSVQIPPHSEPSYYRKFIARMIENYYVEAKGFDIHTYSEVGNALLILGKDLSGHPCFTLYFSYKGETFRYNEQKASRVKLDDSGERYVFTKFKRHLEWEGNVGRKLQNMGLKSGGGAYFYCAQDEDTIYNPDHDSYREYYGLVKWIEDNTEELEKHNIEIQQDASAESDDKFFFGKSELSFEVEDRTDWFDVYAKVYFGNYAYPFIKLKNYILNGIREFKLPDGSIAIIPEEWFTQYYQDLLSFGDLQADEETLAFQKHHFQMIEPLAESKKGINRQVLESAKGLTAQAGSGEGVAVPELLNCELRDYQKSGYAWLYLLKSHGFGGILADDMGLGKTLQTLAILQKVKEEKRQELEQVEEIDHQPDTVFEDEADGLKGQLDLFLNQEKGGVKEKSKGSSVNGRHGNLGLVNLVVMPSSLIHNWQNEIRNFTKGLNTVVFTGPERKHLVSSLERYDVVLTTYGIVRNDVEALENIDFHYMILDESQVIKNPTSKTAKAVKRLSGAHKLVLTGTPVENSLTDLWSQMSFLNPGLLGGYEFFKKQFVTPIEKQNNEEKQDRLKKLISPFFLRRTKEQVAQELPSLTQKTEYCELGTEQEKTYERIKSIYRNQIFENIEQFGIQKSRFLILKGLTQLRLAANHPCMIEGVEGEQDSGKFDEVIRKLEDVLEEGHKILLFSQFVRHLNLFRDYLDSRGRDYAYLTGSTKNREDVIGRFRNQPSCQVFLMSLKAGGVGLNLVEADYVFMVDPWWNPAAEFQAINRTHRIGQDKRVFAYKFITKNTIEEKILKLQEKKAQLAKNVIQANQGLVNAMTEDDVDMLLS